MCIFKILVHLASWYWRGHLFGVVFSEFCPDLVLSDSLGFAPGAAVWLAGGVSASAECELKLSSKHNNNSQVHSGLPANFHCFVLPSYSVRSQLFLCLSCLDPSIVRTWADLVEDGGVLKDDIFCWEKNSSAWIWNLYFSKWNPGHLDKRDCSPPPPGRPSLLAGSPGWGSGGGGGLIFSMIMVIMIIRSVVSFHGLFIGY